MRYVILLSLFFIFLKAKDVIDYSNIQKIEQQELITELPRKKNYYQDDSNIYEEVKNKINNAPKSKEKFITYKNNTKKSDDELIDPLKEDDINIKSNVDINQETKSIEKIEIELGKKF